MGGRGWGGEESVLRGLKTLVAYSGAKVGVMVALQLWLGLAAVAAAQGPRETQAFDQGWRFTQAEATGAEAVGFDDGGWTAVTLPHDWAIAGPFLATNPSGGAGGFAPAGVGWYRKHFVLPAGDATKRVYVEFDGVMANSDVWVNGELLGHRPNGYVSFRYELTGKLKFGAAGNVLAVRADNSKQPSSRWYEGAGIYRHVRLLVMDPVHVGQWSTFVTTPEVSAGSAQVKVESAVVNDSGAPAQVKVRVTLSAPGGEGGWGGESAVQAIAPGQQGSFAVVKAVERPERWELQHAVLYRAKVEVLAAGRVTDAQELNFGIREFHFDPDTGFWLNGKNLKIKGVALHGDVGGLGVAAPVGAWEHRLAALRSMGVNAIRTAHSPPAPDFLDLCDRMGFLVMDEMFDQWTVAKNPYDYHLYFMEWYLRDTRDTVMRDRNHPSVILWSAGNEIHDTPKAELAKSILGPMVAEFHKYDPTRPVTQALFRPNVSHDYEDGLADLLDVVGQNYRPAEILAAHAQKPSRKIIGTENGHGLDQWLPVRDHAEYSGEFIWAGVDYLGEARSWPFIGSGGGLNDRTDAMKPDALERESWWSAAPVVHMVRRVAATRAASTDPGYEPGSPQALALAGGARPAGATPRPAARAEEFGRATVFADWTPENAGPHEEAVEVYSNCASVELKLNGATLGAKARNVDDSARRWKVAFAPGELRATCVGGPGEEVLRTAGKAAKVTLTVERGRLSASFDDVGYVRARVVDAQGTVVPAAGVMLKFAVSGPGVILATDAGDNAYRSPFQDPDRMALRGSAIAIVRATGASGEVEVTVSAEGLTGGSARLRVVR